MIDLHAHVLPGIDDGPKSLEGTLDLLRRAVVNRTRVIAATPHLRADYPLVSVEAIAGECRLLQERIPPAWDIRIVPGGEVDLQWAAAATDDDLRHASYCGRGTDLLVETPYGPLWDGFEDELAALAARGYRILLAHPETNPTLQRSPERVEALVERGVLLQVTAASLLRTRKDASARLAAWLVRRRVAHIIASDAHSGGSWRPSEMLAGRRSASLLAPGRAEWMCNEAPAAILAGEPLPRAPVAPARDQTAAEEAGPPRIAKPASRRGWWRR